MRGRDQSRNGSNQRTSNIQHVGKRDFAAGEITILLCYTKGISCSLSLCHCHFRFIRFSVLSYSWICRTMNICRCQSYSTADVWTTRQFSKNWTNATRCWWELQRNEIWFLVLLIFFFDLNVNTKLEKLVLCFWMPYTEAIHRLIIIINQVSKNHIVSNQRLNRRQWNFSVR